MKDRHDWPINIVSR